VLQIPNVFLNVSKGQSAPAADLAKAFGANMSVDDIILEILNKGELQVGEKERNAQLDRIHNEVIGIVASKLVDPRTKRVYTTGMIEKALEKLSSQGGQAQQKVDKDNSNSAAAGGGTGTPITGEEGEAKGKSHKEHTHPHPHTASWTGVVATKSAKSQALEAMKALIAQQPIPVARARMRLKVICPTNVLKQIAKSREPKGTIKEGILSFVEEVETEDVMGSEWELFGFVEPGAFKELGEFLGNETKGRGRIEVLDMAVTHED
jgi:ribosome maturation protein SDO1